MRIYRVGFNATNLIYASFFIIPELSFDRLLHKPQFEYHSLNLFTANNESEIKELYQFYVLNIIHRIRPR
jgi:hypothetical protein